MGPYVVLIEYALLSAGSVSHGTSWRFTVQAILGKDGSDRDFFRGPEVSRGKHSWSGGPSPLRATIPIWRFENKSRLLGRRPFFLWQVLLYQLRRAPRWRFGFFAAGTRGGKFNFLRGLKKTPAGGKEGPGLRSGRSKKRPKRVMMIGRRCPGGG